MGCFGGGQKVCVEKVKVLFLFPLRFLQCVAGVANLESSGFLLKEALKG